MQCNTTRAEEICVYLCMPSYAFERMIDHRQAGQQHESWSLFLCLIGLAAVESEGLEEEDAE